MPRAASVAALLAALDHGPPTALPRLVGDHVTARTGGTVLGVHLADYDVRVLQSLGSGHRLAVEGSVAGQCLITQEVIRTTVGTGELVFLPMTLRGHRIGVVEVVFERPVDDEVVGHLQEVALATAYAIKADTVSDPIERARRRRPLSLAAEMQWGILPVQSMNAPQYRLAGQLIPAYHVGGDNFDFAVDHTTLTITVTDAMGHGVRASILTALALNAVRCARRGGSTLGHQATFADQALLEQFGGDQFVTAMMLAVDLRTGALETVAAGHPHPYLVRDGRLTQVPLSSQLALGMYESTRYSAQAESLRPGDRLFVVSDGVLDATNSAGEEFGARRLAQAMLDTGQIDPRESVRELSELLLSWQHDGPESGLRDDATLLCLDWHGGAFTST